MATRVHVFVNEPAELSIACTGSPCYGVVAESSEDALIVHLKQAIAFEGKKFKTIVARPRHAGATTEAVLHGQELAMNLMILPEVAEKNAAIGAEPTRTHETLFATGSVRRCRWFQRW
jgi:hypothetical protein